MKKLIIFMAILYFAATGYSLYGRMSYTNLLKEKGDSAFSVAMLGDYADDTFFQDYKKILEEAPYIYKVKATGERIYETKSIGQRAVVEKVFCGNNELVGEDILLIGNYRLFFLEQESGEIMYAMNTGFVNYMQEGHEYLVFIEEQLESPGMGMLYKLVSGIVTPIFDYSPHDNIVFNTPDENSGIPYKQVEDNEFFAGTQKTLDNLLDLKKNMIEKYQ